MSSDNIIIKSIEKKKKRYKVITSEEDYTFSEETIIKYRIFKGQSFTSNEFKEIIKEESLNVLLNKALNFLSYQYRSQKEIEDYLKNKEATVSQTEIIIDKLISLGYINDEAFANNTLDYVIRNHKGPKFLENKLRLKGLEDDVIKNVLLNYDQYLEYEIALELAESLASKNKTLPIKKQKMTLYQKLLRDGFSNEVANDVLNRIEFTDESDDTLKREITKLNNKYNHLSEFDRKNKIINSLMNKGYSYSTVIEKLSNSE